MQDVLKQLTDRIPELVGIGGTAVSLAAALAGVLAARVAAHLAKPELLLEPSAVQAAGPPSREELERQLRITEAKAVLRRQQSSSKWFRRVSGALSAGQYLVGAALASAFVQSSLNASLIGVLGLVVLLAQVTRQAYRPDLRALGATERSLRLREVIRSAEDNLYALGPRPGQESLLQLRLRLSDALAEIDKLEAQELALRLRPVEPPAPGQPQLPTGAPPS